VAAHGAHLGEGLAGRLDSGIHLFERGLIDGAGDGAVEGNVHILRMGGADGFAADPHGVIGMG